GHVGVRAIASFPTRRSSDLAHGWTLQLTTGRVDTFVPGVGTSGVADTYPVTQTVHAPVDGVINDVNVSLSHVAADRASDPNLLLDRQSTRLNSSPVSFSYAG